MLDLDILSPELAAPPVTVKRRLPRWLKRPMPQPGMAYTSSVISDLRLETVCESARCPNRTECWSKQTATFMILGEVCTRRCSFCDVAHGRPKPPDADELKAFRDHLQILKAPIARRYSGGKDIGAACGTLEASSYGGSLVGAPPAP